MKRRFCHRLFILLILFIPCKNAFTYEYVNSTLENELEIYTIYDSTLVSSKVYYMNNAGYSIQEPGTTGFAELYKNLFWHTTENFEIKANELLMSNFHSDLYQNYAMFSYEVSSEYLPKSLQLLSEMLKNPKYPDSEIKKSFEEIRLREMHLKNKPEGFINAAIDSRIFADMPWKHSSGMYPELFAMYETERTRSVLKYIQKLCYCPKNSFLIIVSPFENDQVMEFVKKNFSDWKNNSILQGQAVYDTSKDKIQKKYVIVTDAISEELNQIVIQYHDKNFFNSEENQKGALMAAMALEYQNSRFKKLLCSNQKLGIIGEEYINSSFSQAKNDSRIIIQSLTQSSLASPSEQAEIFASAIKICSKFTEDENYQVKKQLEYQHSLSSNSSDEFASFIAYQCAFNKNSVLSSFYELQKYEDISAIQMEKVFEREPYVFLLIHPATYSKYKRDFTKKGWETLSSENAFWYTNSKYTPFVMMAIATTSNLQKLGKSEDKKTSEPAPVSQKILENMKDSSYSGKLKNGIDYYCVENNLCSNVTLLIHVDGGEILHEKTKRGMESVLLKNLAKNIEMQIKKAYEAKIISDMASIKVESKTYSGFISVTFVSQDFDNICRCINNAMAFGNTTPAMEDEIILQDKSLWQFESSGVDLQLKYRALSHFFKNSGYDYLFSCTSDILQDVSYNEISALYAQFLDSRVIKLIISGNSGKQKDELEELLSKTFAILRSKEPKIVKRDFPIDFKETVQIAKVKRIFGSDISAKDAGPRPEHLIPTSEFKDPALVFIRCPKMSEENYADFLLALEAMKEKIKRQGIKSELISDARLFQFEELDSFIALEFFEVKNSKSLYKLFSDITNSNEILTDSEIAKAKISIQKELFEGYGISEETAIILDSNLCRSGNAFFYIGLFEKLQKSQSSNVRKAYSDYVSKCETYWIFSADTKR